MGRDLKLIVLPNKPNDENSEPLWTNLIDTRKDIEINNDHSSSPVKSTYSKEKIRSKESLKRSYKFPKYSRSDREEFALDGAIDNRSLESPTSHSTSSFNGIQVNPDDLLDLKRSHIESFQLIFENSKNLRSDRFESAWKAIRDCSIEERAGSAIAF
ncbi:MAG: hypothetical protein ABI041_07715, partial [Bdellovibrionia bacterium]